MLGKQLLGLHDIVNAQINFKTYNICYNMKLEKHPTPVKLHCTPVILFTINLH